MDIVEKKNIILSLERIQYNILYSIFYILYNKNILTPIRMKKVSLCIIIF